LTNCEHPFLDEEEFYLKWEAWEAQGLVNYSVVQRHSSPCTGNGVSRILVQDNSIINTESVGNYGDAGFVYTISEVYELINKNYKNGIRIRITYSEEFLYPMYIEFGALLFAGTGPTIIEISEFTLLTAEDFIGGNVEAEVVFIDTCRKTVHDNNPNN
jgi:hypothetical protein